VAPRHARGLAKEHNKSLQLSPKVHDLLEMGHSESDGKLRVGDSAAQLNSMLCSTKPNLLVSHRLYLRHSHLVISTIGYNGVFWIHTKTICSLRRRLTLRIKDDIYIRTGVFNDDKIDAQRREAGHSEG
jgi:hypothetical protein